MVPVSYLWSVNTEPMCDYLDHSPEQYATECHEQADEDGGGGGPWHLLGLLQHDTHVGDGGVMLWSDLKGKCEEDGGGEKNKINSRESPTRWEDEGETLLIICGDAGDAAMP